MFDGKRMSDLYSLSKSAMQAISAPLFEFSEECLRKRNNFVPHGAVLTEEGKLVFVGAAPDLSNRTTNSAEVLPILHDGLREEASKRTIIATGVAENVTIVREGHASTKAIKVLFEHQNGLTVALYLPFTKRFLKGYEFGSMFSVAAQPEVNAWRGIAAQSGVQAGRTEKPLPGGPT